MSFLTSVDLQYSNLDLTSRVSQDTRRVDQLHQTEPKGQIPS